MRSLRALGVAIGLGVAGCWDNNIPTEAPRPTVVGGRFVRVTGNGAQDTVLTQVPVVTVRLTDSAGAPVASEQVEVRFLPTTLPLTNQQITLCSGPLAVVRFGADTALTSTAVSVRTDSRGEVNLRVARGCRAQSVPLEFFVPRLLVRDTVRFVTLPGRAVAFDVRAAQRVLTLGDTAITVVNLLDRFANGSDAGVPLEGDTGIAVSGRRATATAIGDWVVRASAVVGGTTITDTALYSVAPRGNITYVGFDTLIGYNTIMSAVNRARLRLARTPVPELRPAFLPGTDRLAYAHIDSGATAPQTLNIRVRLGADGTRADADLFALRGVVPGFFGAGRVGSGAARVFVVRSTPAGNRLVSLDTASAAVSEVPTAFPARAVSVSPRADLFVEGYDRTASTQDSLLTLRDLATGAAVRVVRGINAVGFAWSPTAPRLVAFTIDNELVGLSVADGSRYGRCGGATANFAISPDGRFAGWLNGNQLTYCDLATGRSTLLGCIVPAARCSGEGPQLFWRPDA